jgi:uncharacterized protein YjiS (DUF1127 family)
MTLASTWFHLWRQRMRERRAAAQFTDHGLWDLALTPGDIAREFSQPFWRCAAGPSMRVPSSTRADVIISDDRASASASV